MSNWRRVIFLSFGILVSVGSVWASDVEIKEETLEDAQNSNVLNQLFVYHQLPFAIRLFKNYHDRFTFSLCEESENPYQLNGCKMWLGREAGYTLDELFQLAQQEGGGLLNHSQMQVRLQVSSEDIDLISIEHLPSRKSNGASDMKPEPHQEAHESSDDRRTWLSRGELNSYDRGQVGLIRFEEILTGETLELVEVEPFIQLRMCTSDGCTGVGRSEGYRKKELLPPQQVYTQRRYEVQDESHRTISFFRESKTNIRVYYCQNGDQNCQEMGVRGGYREKDLFLKRDFGSLEIHSKYAPPKFILFKKKGKRETVHYCDGGAVHLRRFVWRKCFAVDDRDPQLIHSIWHRLKLETSIDFPLTGYRQRFLRFEKVGSSQRIQISIHTCEEVGQKNNCTVVYQSPVVEMEEFEKIKKINLNPTVSLEEYIKVDVVESTGVVSYKLCQRWKEKEICEFLGSPKGYLLSTILNIPKEGWMVVGGKTGISTAGTGLLTWMTLRSFGKRAAKKMLGKIFFWVLLPFTVWSVSETILDIYKNISTGVVTSSLGLPKNFDPQGSRKSLTIMEMQGYLLKALNVRKDSTGSIYYITQEGPN